MKTARTAPKTAGARWRRLRGELVSAADEVNKLLKESGAVLLRDTRHEVWRLPNGQKFTRPRTPSDQNGARNSLCDLKKALGIENRGSGPGERREKRRTAGAAAPKLKLQRARPAVGLSGLLEGALAEAVSQAEAAKRRAGTWKQAARLYRTVALSEFEATGRLREQIGALESRPCPCWWCRLWSKVREKVTA